MSAPSRTKLGPSTPARKWWLDVNTNTEAEPIWTPVNGIGEFKPLNLPSMQDSGDFDSDFSAKEASLIEWGAEFKVKRKVKSGAFTEYDTGQEALRAAGNAVLGSNRVQIRYYEMTTGGPRVEAYKGWVTVDWGEDGGAAEALDVVSVKLHGQTDRVAITHPDAEASVPTVVSITPNTGVIAGGEAAHIYGQYFLGASAVKIGVTAVTDYVVFDDNHISIVTPAKSAGPYTVYVTNPNGTNATGPTFTYS